MSRTLEKKKTILCQFEAWHYMIIWIQQNTKMKEDFIQKWIQFMKQSFLTPFVFFFFFLQVTRVVYKSWFQVWGSPGTHQCVQSMPLKQLYLLGCTSFLNWESFVIFKGLQRVGSFVYLRPVAQPVGRLGYPTGRMEGYPDRLG